MNFNVFSVHYVLSLVNMSRLSSASVLCEVFLYNLTVKIVIIFTDKHLLHMTLSVQMITGVV